MADSEIRVKIGADTSGLNQVDAGLTKTQAHMAQLRAEFELAQVQATKLGAALRQAAAEAVTKGVNVDLGPMAAQFNEATAHARTLKRELEDNGGHQPFESLFGRLQIMPGMFLRVRESLSGFKEGLEAVAAAYGIEKLVAWTLETAEAAERTVNLASAVGISAGEYSKLSAAMRLSGGDAESSTRGLLMLQRRMMEVLQNPDSHAGDVFRTLRTSYDDLNKRLSSGDLVGSLRILAGVYKEMGEAGKTAERANAFGELFGNRQLANMVPLLRGGTEGFDEKMATGGKTGAAISDKDLETLEKLAEKANEFHAALTGLKNAVAIGLAEPLTGVLGIMTSIVEQSRGLVGTGLLLGGAGAAVGGGALAYKLATSGIALHGAAGALTESAAALTGAAARLAGAPAVAAAGGGAAAAAGGAGATGLLMRAMPLGLAATAGVLTFMASALGDNFARDANGRPTGGAAAEDVAARLRNQEFARDPDATRARLFADSDDAHRAHEGTAERLDGAGRKDAAEKSAADFLTSQQEQKKLYEETLAAREVQARYTNDLRGLEQIARDRLAFAQKSPDEQTTFLNEKVPGGTAALRQRTEVTKAQTGVERVVHEEEEYAQHTRLAELELQQDIARRREDFAAVVRLEAEKAAVVINSSHSTAAERVQAEQKVLDAVRQAKDEAFKLDEQALASDQRLDDMRLRIATSGLKQRVAAHEISSAQEAALEATLSAQTFAGEEARVQAALNNDDLTLQQKARLFDQLATLYEKDADKQIELQARVTKAVEAENQRRVAALTQAFDSAGSTLSNAITGLLTGKPMKWLDIRNALIGDVVKSGTSLASQFAGKSLAPALGVKISEGDDTSLGNVLGRSLGNMLGLTKTAPKPGEGVNEKMQAAADAEQKAADLQRQAADAARKAADTGAQAGQSLLRAGTDLQSAARSIIEALTGKKLGGGGGGEKPAATGASRLSDEGRPREGSVVLGRGTDATAESGQAETALKAAMQVQGERLKNYCAILVNQSLDAAGVPGSGSGLASSFGPNSKFGTPVDADDVRRGDVFYSPPSGMGDTGHVGLTMGPVQDGRVQVMSSHMQGAASNPAGVEWRNADNLSFRRPDYSPDNGGGASDRLNASLDLNTQATTRTAQSADTATQATTAATNATQTQVTAAQDQSASSRDNASQLTTNSDSVQKLTTAVSDNTKTKGTGGGSAPGGSGSTDTGDKLMSGVSQLAGLGGAIASLTGTKTSPLLSGGLGLLGSVSGMFSKSGLFGSEGLFGNPFGFGKKGGGGLFGGLFGGGGNSGGNSGGDPLKGLTDSAQKAATSLTQAGSAGTTVASSLSTAGTAAVTAGTGLTTTGAAATTAGAGLTTTGAGATTAGAGLATAGTGATVAGTGMTTAGTSAITAGGEFQAAGAEAMAGGAASGGGGLLGGLLGIGSKVASLAMAPFTGGTSLFGLFAEQGALVPSAAGGMMVNPVATSLPGSVRTGLRNLATAGAVGPFGAGKLVGGAGNVPDGKGGRLAIVHPGELIVPAAETGMILGAMSSEGGAVVAGGLSMTTPRIASRADLSSIAGSGSLSSSQAAAAASGGDAHFHAHFHGPADGPSIDRWFKANMLRNADAVSRMFRQGRLSARSI